MSNINTNRSSSASGSKARTSISSSTIALGGSTFNRLALDVSLGGVSFNKNGTPASSSANTSSALSNVQDIPENNEARYDDELWEDIGVIECLERKLGIPDESTEEERVEALKEVLQDTDIHEGDGDLSEFLFHVARTKHGKIYIRVIRTLLLNRALKYYRMDKI